MTTEKKAKAYDEALTLAKRIISKNCTEVEKLLLKCIFPQLAESEDEKVRKEIIEVLQLVPSSMWEQAKTNYERCFAYLEKQKEQKLVEKQDYSGLNDLERAIHRGFLSAGVGNVPVGIIKETAQECLTNIKSAEWSEEDEKNLNEIIHFFESLCSSLATEERHAENRRWLNFLKSLRPQPKKNDMITPNKEFFQWIYNRLVDVHNENPNVDYMISFKKRIEEMSFDKSHWKPSEEQMKALEDAFRKNGSDEYRKTINSLYQDLKKLM